jgi:hypothetical protein
MKNYTKKMYKKKKLQKGGDTESLERYILNLQPNYNSDMPETDKVLYASALVELYFNRLNEVSENTLGLELTQNKVIDFLDAMSEIEEKYDVDEYDALEYIDYLEDDDNTPYIEKNKTDAIGLYNAFENNNENSNPTQGGKKKRKTNRRKTNRRKTNRRKTKKIIK